MSMSYAEYLVLERGSDVRHEYLRGEIFAMAGGTPEHAALGAALTIALGNALRGRPCRVFSGDLRVRVPDTDLATYPDVSVVCEQLLHPDDDPHAVTNPALLVEVLSDSTEAYDRGDKAAHYRRIPSLKAYLLVAQSKPRLELYTRNDAGRWELTEAGPGEKLAVAPLNIELAVDEIYADPFAEASS